MTIAGYTFLEMQQEVLEFQFSEIKYRPLIKRWLNQGVRRAVIEAELRTSEEAASYTTTSGDATLELPADFARIIDLYDEDENDPLDRLSLREFDDLEDASGRPTAYTVEDDQIRVYPTPDGAYNLGLRYRRLPEDMVADSDVPELPVQYQELPIAYAMKKAYLRENDRVQAATWDAEWQAGILKMRGEVSSDTFIGPSQVSGTWGDEAALIWSQ